MLQVIKSANKINPFRDDSFHTICCMQQVVTGIHGMSPQSPSGLSPRLQTVAGNLLAADAHSLPCNCTGAIRKASPEIISTNHSASVQLLQSNVQRPRIKN
jgi:hypothetical protein